jgi:hypothetical protein
MNKTSMSHHNRGFYLEEEVLLLALYPSLLSMSNRDKNNFIIHR